MSLAFLITDCVVALHVGASPEEREKPQPILINLEVTTDITHDFCDPQHDWLAQTLDYSQLHRFLRETLPQQEPRHLLETVAAHILAFCFDDIRVTAATVRLEKPQLYPHTQAVGVVMRRGRSAAA